ncbi:MAG TPA: helix-turn-helix domain-containing protein [Candidatus Binataceae bacterium]|nr:helix-turn-helix domain-containing protein [Candidatus Binataceae bacterium]
MAINAEVAKRKPLQGDIITASELAEFLELHPSMRLRRSTIYRLLRRGQLPIFKVGADWGFNRKSIDRIARLENSKYQAQ